MGHWGCYMVNISLVVVPAGWGAAAERTLGLFSFFLFFFFHMDFDAISDTESKAGFWGKGLGFLNPSPSTSRNASGMPEFGKAKQPFYAPPSDMKAASTAGAA